MGPMETLRERLDDRAAWAVYADWLSSQGDPTGELCALELQAPTDRSRIVELKQARRDGRGDWHPLDVKVARAEKSLAFGWLWFAGHLRAVRLENPWNGSLAQTLDDVLSAPCGRFLRALELSQHFPDDRRTSSLPSPRRSTAARPPRPTSRRCSRVVTYRS